MYKHKEYIRKISSLIEIKTDQRKCKKQTKNATKILNFCIKSGYGQKKLLNSFFFVKKIYFK